jgi:hypothetical protein
MNTFISIFIANVGWLQDYEDEQPRDLKSKLRQLHEAIKIDIKVFIRELAEAYKHESA